MSDPANRRLELDRQISELSRLQIKSVKDATFFGWVPAETVAYEERGRQLVALRNELAALDDKS
jgi:hypothetical protein